MTTEYASSEVAAGATLHQREGIRAMVSIEEDSDIKR